MSLVRSLTVDGVDALFASMKGEDVGLFGSIDDTAESKVQIPANTLSIAQNHSDILAIQASIATNTEDIAANRMISCTSTTRPTANLFLGMRIYETDTKATGFWNGSAWVMTDTVWQSYTPTFTAPPGGVPVIGSGGWLMGRYFRIGKRIDAVIDLNLGSTGAYGGASGNVWQMGLPFPGLAVTPTEPSGQGPAWVSPNGATQWPGFAYMISTTALQFYAASTNSGGTMAIVAGAQNVGGTAITLNARLRTFFTYNAA